MLFYSILYYIFDWFLPYNLIVYSFKCCVHWKLILSHNYCLFQDLQMTSDGEWKPLCCSACPGFVGRCLYDQCVNVAQVDEGETACYEFLWLVHPLKSCFNTLTYSAAVFTLKQSSGSICFWEFIYWSACQAADMELTFLEWRITVVPWERQ